MIWLLPISAMLSVALCLACKGRVSIFLGTSLRRVAILTRHPWRAAALLFGLSLFVNAVMTLASHWPVPGIHDEFSYLLAADTFAHGRLTNPTPPAWEHFETFHEIMRPTYASKYPPAQGLLLALGQVLTSRPIVGAWIGNALACVAIFWALLAWLPRRWALIGGLLAMVHPLVLEWGQCFWGGAAATIGGALVTGGYRRVTRFDIPRFFDSALFGVGLLILANSRPFEGFVLGLMIGVSLLVRVLMASSRNAAASSRVQLAFRALAPMSLVLAAGGVWMAFYNDRVTGEAHKLPYSVHEQAYAVTPLFIWQKPRPAPEYRHKAIQDFWMGWALDFHKRQQTIKGWAFDCGRKVWTFSKAYLWQFVMAIPTGIGLLAVLGDRKARFAALMVGGYLLLLFNLSWPLQPHYAGPFFGCVLLLQLQGIRRLVHIPNPRAGSAVAVGLLVACLLSPFGYWLKHRSDHTGNTQRIDVIADLEKLPGNHLIIVRYADHHSAHDEWVYNEADIRHQRVVWARDMGSVKNRDLLHAFPERTVWLFEADWKPRKFVPYQE